MGYYSNVAIGMSKDDGVKFLNDFAINVSDSTLLDRGFLLSQYPNFLVFQWNDVKWYDDYRDVSWIYKYLNTLEED